jgi:hypothetical protein
VTRTAIKGGETRTEGLGKMPRHTPLPAGAAVPGLAMATTLSRDCLPVYAPALPPTSCPKLR